MPRFEPRAVPIVLAAVTVDVIGFGIVMPVLPALVTTLGRVGLAEATRIGGWLLAAFAAAQVFVGAAFLVAGALIAASGGLILAVARPVPASRPQGDTA